MRTERDRRDRLRRALRLEWFTVAWNLLEAGAAIVAGTLASSIALVGFGLDSIVESSSASVLIWRLRAETGERRSPEEAERVAVRGVALAFFALAAYVGGRAVFDLVTGSRPEQSIPGIVVAVVSLIVMPLLAWRKRVAARTLDSRSLRADSTQTELCVYLSAALLVGLGANALWGWWWADPGAALVVAAIAAREGRELWTTEHMCCP